MSQSFRDDAIRCLDGDVPAVMVVRIGDQSIIASASYSDDPSEVSSYFLETLASFLAENGCLLSQHGYTFKPSGEKA